MKDHSDNAVLEIMLSRVDLEAFSIMLVDYVVDKKKGNPNIELVDKYFITPNG